MFQKKKKHCRFSDNRLTYTENEQLLKNTLEEGKKPRETDHAFRVRVEKIRNARCRISNIPSMRYYANQIAYKSDKLDFHIQLIVAILFVINPNGDGKNIATQVVNILRDKDKLLNTINEAMLKVESLSPRSAWRYISINMNSHATIEAGKILADIIEQHGLNPNFDTAYELEDMKELAEEVAYEVEDLSLKFKDSLIDTMVAVIAVIETSDHIELTEYEIWKVLSVPETLYKTLIEADELSKRRHALFPRDGWDTIRIYNKIDSIQAGSILADALVMGW